MQSTVSRCTTRATDDASLSSEIDVMGRFSRGFFATGAEGETAESRNDLEVIRVEGEPTSGRMETHVGERSPEGDGFFVTNHFGPSKVRTSFDTQVGT